MPGIERGLAYIGIWLACSSIVLDATNPQDSVSGLSSQVQNDSATRAQRSVVSIRHFLGSGNPSDGEDQHRFFGIHFGSGHIIHQYRSIEKEKKETVVSEMSRSSPKIEDQGNEVATVVDRPTVESSTSVDQLEEQTNGSIATTQELRSLFDRMSARIASIDRSLAGIADLTNKTLIRSEQMLAAYNSTSTKLDEIESMLCPYPRSGSSTSGSKSPPNDCWEIYQAGCYESGIYKIRPSMPGADAFSVYCDMDARGGGWTALQTRMDGSVDFAQPWFEYKKGFGTFDGEFWLGLQRIYQLTNSKRYELLVELEDFDGETRFAVYDNFVVSSEEEKYSLQMIGSYSGTAGNGLRDNLEHKFSTWDQDNDPWTDLHIGLEHGGGWWYESRGYVALNGYYHKGQLAPNQVHGGIRWSHWDGRWSYSFMGSRMSIRPLSRESTQSEHL